MANEDIGIIDCPMCDYPGAHVRQSKNGRPYVYCDGCEYQGFARGKGSAEQMLQKMKPVESKPAGPAEPDKPAKATKKKTEKPAEKKTEEKTESDDDWGY